MSNPELPPAEESLRRLHRSGCSCGEAGFTGTSGSVWQVDATNGDQRIVGRGATPAEAWHGAVQATVAAGMLTD